MKRKGESFAGNKKMKGLLPSLKMKGASPAVKTGGLLPDYRTALPQRKTLLLSALRSLLLVLAADYLFYRRWWMLPFLLPLGGVYMLREIEEAKRARRKKLRADFREMLSSLSASLRAGYSVENALAESAREMENRLGRDADMTRELIHMAHEMRVSVPPAELLRDFASRSHVEDIEDFAAVFSIAQRSGGNMAGIIRTAAGKIAGKIEVEREIEAVLAAKVYEQRIMSVLPAAIILYVGSTSPGFFDVLYGNLFGIAVMTVFLLVYGAGVYWGARIADIRM
ncbi:MAG: type II secretion system F family protein [Lachnospiraceae bacterium]|nr:type II secretion system F family protein [Lachnospiraceae bacterium]